MSSSVKVSVVKEGPVRRYLLDAPYTHKEICRKIPSGLWDRRRRVWSYAHTPAVAQALRDAFPGLLVPYPKRRSPPAKLVFQTKPWKHQLRAVKQAFDQPGWLLNMRMGTGKTKVALDLVRNAKAHSVLVLCPLGAVDVWRTEYQKHGTRSHAILALDSGSVAQRTERADDISTRPHIVVINYEAAWLEPFASWSLNRRWDYVIADEVHRIKAAGGKWSRYMASLAQRADHRLGLSGTPLPHSLVDAYGVFRFLDVGIFGLRVADFKNRYCVMGGWHNKEIIGWQNVDDFTKRFHSITTLVSDDALTLPPVIDLSRHGKLDSKTRELYGKLDIEFTADVGKGTVTADNALTRLLRLQQIANGHTVTDDGEKIRVGNDKKALLMETLGEIEENRPVVVFCRFKMDLLIVHEVAESLNRPSWELSGSRKELEKWRESVGVLAVQIAAGKEAIDLTHTSYVIYYCTGLSLGDYEQSRKRVHRPGQERTTHFIHLLMRNTVDVSTLRAIRQRKQIIESIIEERRHVQGD